MKNVLAHITVLVICFACARVHSQEPGLTEFRMRPGDSSNYALHVKTGTESTWHRTRGIERRTLDFKSDMNVLIRCVKVSDEGVMHLEITYPDFRIETSITRAGLTSRIVADREGARFFEAGRLQDSASWDELEKQGRPNLAKLLGSLIGFTLDKTGRVLDVDVSADIADRFPGLDLRQFYRQQVILPGVPVAPGAEWSDTSERSAPAGPPFLRGRTMIDETAYKYQKNETATGKECARIAITIASRPKEKIPNLKTFKQTSEGWSLVALDNGQLIQSHLRLSQAMEGTQDGIRVETKTTGEVKTNLVLPSTGAASSTAEEPPATKE